MKKLNAKGFTLIELLAVVTIMGILLLVAIPAVSRTIENTRRDTFLDTAKQYANSVKTLWISDSLECSDTPTNNDTYELASTLSAGSYYVKIDTSAASGLPVLLESGGKSAWGSADVSGYVLVTVDTNGKATYSVAIADTKGNGIQANTGDYLNLKRSDVKTGLDSTDTDDTNDKPAVPTTAGTYTCREA